MGLGRSLNGLSLDLFGILPSTSLTLKFLIDEQTRINEQAWKKVLSKLINEQCGIFRLLHEKLRAGWKENLKNLSEHALLLGTSE